MKSLKMLCEIKKIFKKPLPFLFILIININNNNNNNRKLYTNIEKKN